MTTKTKKSAARATNTNGLHTRTNASDFPCAETSQQANDSEAILQHCVNPGEQPDKPDVPDSAIANDQFLSVIFKDLIEPHRPFVLGFSGNPKARKRGGVSHIGMTGLALKTRL